MPVWPSASIRLFLGEWAMYHLMYEKQILAWLQWKVVNIMYSLLLKRLYICFWQTFVKYKQITLNTNQIVNP